MKSVSIFLLIVAVALGFYFVKRYQNSDEKLRQQWVKTSEDDVQRMGSARMQVGKMPADFTAENLKDAIMRAEMHLQKAPKGASTEELERELKKTKEALASLAGPPRKP